MIRQRSVTMPARFVAAAALGVGALLPVGAVPAEASTCSGASGVSVVVDFGGSVRTGCAAGDPTSAWAALQSAGFTVEGTQRFPTTFVCRIDGYPAPAQEACIQTPPATAYWALWSAPAGGQWTYATLGAASLDPAPGTAIGVAFGAGRSPSLAPPAAPTSSTTRPPTSTTSRPPASSTTRPASTTTGASSHSTSAGTTTPPGSTTPISASTSPRSPATSATTASASSTTAAPGASAGGEPSAYATGTTAKPAGGNPALIVGGGAGVGVLLVAGAYAVRRQRDRATRE
ncbi:MAG: hypothetical protein U0Q21_01145 [Dermatophilaceae bacterium]